MRSLLTKATTQQEFDEIDRILKDAQAGTQADKNSDAYARHKANARNLQKKKSDLSRDIAATCPEIKDAETLARITADLRFSLETLFPLRFNLSWGPDHLELIADLQNSIESGDQIVRAMPRGNGKTSLLICAIIWAVLTGRHQFAVLIGSTADAAKELLEQITTELETNDQIYDYFPQLIHPVRMLEGIHQRKLLWNGKPIQQNWKKDRIILPSIKGVAGASAIIKTAGLLGRIRGMNFQRTDGKNARPTLVLVDDPQTDASAISDKENDKRESVICSTIPGLAGPGKKTAMMVAVTVKSPGDLADRMLCRTKHPEWHGKRTSLLSSIPTDTDLWNQYAGILRECQRADEPITRATDFYRLHREEMDAGGKASWEARYNTGQISAIQFGMQLRIENPAMFASEYQNCPLVLEEYSAQTDADQVVLRLSGRNRGVIPLEVETLTAGVDVQKNYLVYTVGGFATNATPFIVDYGTFPDQKTHYFDRRTAKRTIESTFPGLDPDAQIWAALDGLFTKLFGNEYKREDGLRMNLKKLCVDVRYKGQVIKRYVRQSTHRDALLPAQGIHTNPGSAGINDRDAKPGEVSKHDFRLPPMAAGQIARTVSFESSEYISKVHDALTTPRGAPGALTLFNAEPHQHRCFADQLCSEYSTQMEVKGRKRRVWQLKPNGGDNDFLDSTKLMFLAAYVSGVEPSYVPRATKKLNTEARKPRYAAI